MAIKARAEITLSSIRDIQSVTRYYLLQSSTSTAPAKPTKNPPGGNWVTTEPTYTSGSTNSLYFTDCTVFSDGTFVYSDVSLSSSYEAAKVAYNKAAGAEDVANSANEKIDNLEIGGRNLIRRTDYAIYGNDSNYKHYANQSPATFSSDRITVPFGTEIWHSTPYSQNLINKTIPAGTKVLCSVYVYEQSISDGSHRLYVSRLKTNGSINWDNAHTIPYGFTGLLTWVYTPPEDIKGFCLDFDTRNSTSGQMVLGPVKAELGTKPTDWTPAPEDLDEAITAAQETANGKNTVYYQASAPTGGTYKTNDIWFDTNNGNKMYMWNGSAWTPEQFGNAAISDLSITNAKIANGTIESAKISNLDAGKITSGTMSAARIKGDTLTLGGANNVDGMMAVYDANGNLVGSFTREGLMAIAGTIGGWNINEDLLEGQLTAGEMNWTTSLSKLGLRFRSFYEGDDPASQWRREVYYSLGITRYSHADNGNQYTGAITHFTGSDGLKISPKLFVCAESATENSGDAITRITHTTVDSNILKSMQLWLLSLGTGGGYVQQPQMILSGVVTVSTGTSEKNLTLCTIPTYYQSGYRIVPFVSRRYGAASGTPSDDGDFYYAYYNSVTHNVHIKLANKLASGTIYQFDYMIYVVPD